VIAACARHAAAVVPQGGNTGLVGASVPRHGEVVVSTTRLNEIGEIDSARGQVTVGAGVTLAALQDAARSAGEDAAHAHSGMEPRVRMWPASRPCWPTAR
jgi:FAD/FMN-containing dehydrogenase